MVQGTPPTSKDRTMTRRSSVPRSSLCLVTLSTKKPKPRWLKKKPLLNLLKMGRANSL